MASIAESFRSTCGSERGAPQCTPQRRPAATPHVGHGTDDNCFVVSSFFPVENCPMTPYRKTIPFGTLLGTSRSPGESKLLLLLINALPESSRVHSGCIVGHPEVIVANGAPSHHRRLPASRCHLLGSNRNESPRISNGKSASLQRLVGHCWRVYRDKSRGITSELPVWKADC
jgi:hypothetical protein